MKKIRLLDPYMITIFVKQKVPKSANRLTKISKMQKKMPKKVQKSVKKEGFCSICAIIYTRRESPCLPHAGFFILSSTLAMIGEQWILGFV